MRCPKCKRDSPSEALFCMKCGIKLERKCPKCGAEYPEEAVFCMKCGTKLNESSESVIPKLEDMQDKLYIPEPLRQRMDTAKQELQGENRLVTALFADISGFTPLSNQHSTENVVNIVNDCFKVIVDTIFRYEGNPNRFIGDNVLAFFGAPITHENDPERAIMSALEMRDKVRELSLNISVGINTGLMYFGPIGTKEHLEVSAYGPDINLAKRLQEIAEPGQIMVGSGTYRLTKRAFDFQQTPSLNLKGIDKPVTAYEAVKIKEHPEKLRGIEGLQSRMIGREREFTELKDAVDTWLSGQGQMVSIIGEAGIGKSRLAKEIKGFLNDKSCMWLEGRCISIGQPISYWPFIDMFRTLFDLKEDDNEKEIANKVRNSITDLFPNRADDILPFIGHLMSIQFGDELDSKLDGYGSEQIRYQTIVRLRDIFATIARSNPLLLILEDLHWADDLSIDLISLLMDELVTSQMLLLCVYRPEQDHKCWKLSGMAQRKCFESYTELQLKKLNRIQSYEMVQSLLAIDALPDNVRDMILGKSEGNPFFIEEVIRSLMERGLVYKDGDRWTAKEGIEHIDVPDTIHGVIMERIDRLELETKYVLQCASVIGRLFRYRLLDHLMSHERKLDDYLDELEGKELVLEERAMPELEYTFKHALTQEATYQTILEQRRRQFHRQVAEGIERLYQDRIEEFYEELAHHWERSRDQKKTLEYLVKSGQKAFNRYANDLAINYYTHAITLAKELDISGDRLAEIYDLRGATHEGARFYEETIDDYSEAAKLYKNHTKRAYIFQKLASFYARVVNDNDKAMKYTLMGVEEIDPMDKSRDASKAYSKAGAYLIYYHTDLQKGENLMQKAIEISKEMGYSDLLADQYTTLTELYNYYPSRLSNEVRRKWQEAREKALWYLEHFKPDDLRNYAWLCLVLGNNVEVDEFEYFKREAIESGIRCGDDWTVLHAATNLGFYYHGNGDIQKAIEAYEKAWSAGIKMRYVYQRWMQYLIYELISLYASRHNWTRLLEMMSEALDSTKFLHSKPKVNPTVLSRWNNNIVDGIYKTLRMAAPETYHDFKEVLISRVNETNNGGEKFFYLSQLMLLELLDGHINSAKDYMHKMKDFQLEAGSFAERVSKRLIWASRLLRVEPEQYKTITNELLISLDHLDDFQDAIDTISWILSKDEIAVTVDWHQLVDYLFKRYGSDIIESLVEMERIFMRYGHSDQLQSLEEKLQQSMSDKLKAIGNPQIFMEMTESAKPGNLKFVENFKCDPALCGWEWANPEAYFSYHLLDDNGITALEISVPLRHGFWMGEHKEARLLCSINGDFVLETHIRDGSKGKKFGGLFVWKDNDNYIRFEVHVMPRGCIVSYEANVNGVKIFPGVHPCDEEETWLRLERKGNIFTGYISPDGKSWYLCGWLDFTMDDSIRVGIQSLCPLLPMTSTEFEYFKIYRSDKQTDS